MSNKDIYDMELFKTNEHLILREGLLKVFDGFVSKSVEAIIEQMKLGDDASKDAVEDIMLALLAWNDMMACVARIPQWSVCGEGLLKLCKILHGSKLPMFGNTAKLVSMYPEIHLDDEERLMETLMKYGRKPDRCREILERYEPGYVPYWNS